MKRALAMLLAFCLIIGQLPAAVFAEEIPTEPEETISAPETDHFREAPEEEPKEELKDAVEVEPPVLNASAIDYYPVIEADTTFFVETSDTQKELRFRFTPQYTESFTLRGNGQYDIWCTLYDAELNYLDGGSGYNNILTGTLTAGTTYVFSVSLYGNNDNTCFELELVTNHSGEGTVATPATCTEDGIMTFHCDGCGLLFAETIPGGHNWDEGVITETAGCTSYGERIYTCSVCGETQRELLPMEHSWDDNRVCTLCGEVWFDSGYCGYDVSWYLDNEGTLTISGTGPMYDYNSYPDYAPWKNERILSVVIEEGVTTVGDFAFYECSDITNAVLPQSLISIGTQAFSYTDLEGIFVPDTVTEIEERAFSYCDRMRYADLREGLESIGDYAFIGCDLLQELYIPATVSRFNGTVIAGCDSLAMPSISPENPWFVTEGNVVYTSDRTTMVWIDTGYVGCYSVADHVQVIGPCVFENCSGLTGITFPSGLVEIGEDAFGNCSGLNDIEIPEGVTTIGEDAFSGCYNVSSLYLPSTLREVGMLAFYYVRLTDLYIGDLASWCGIDFPCHASSTTTNPLGNAQNVHFNGQRTTELRIPDTVSRVGAYTFYRGSRFSDVSIPASVTEIGAGAFAYMDQIAVTFEGDAPRFEQEIPTWSAGNICVFDGSTVTAYYPVGNPTWTEEVLARDYGGTITWVAYDPWEEYPVLEADTETTVQIENGGDCVYFRFTPEYTESYTFCSMADRDTYGYLYDGQMNQLAYNDDGGEDGNFSITYTLEAGETYVLAARYYSSDNTGSFPVMLQTNHEAEGVVVKPATCTEDGEMQYTCLICGLVYTEVIPAGHTYQDGYCTRCGAEDILLKGICGENAFWKLSSEGVLTIYGSGQMSDYYIYSDENRPPWYSHSESITSVVFEEGITSIGDYAFSNCSNLTEISGGNIASVGEWAFCYCYALTELYIPDSVITIGPDAFRSCEGLNTVSIGAGVVSIGENAFYGCTSLSGFSVDADNASYSSDAHGVLYNKDKTILIKAPEALSGDFTVPDSVITIESHAFDSCNSLTGVSIGENVASIGAYAFYYCTSLEDVTLGSRVVTIDEGAFYSCSGLSNIVIPDGVTSIGEKAFYDCDSLEQITIGSGVSQIGEQAFTYCTNLTAFLVDPENAVFSSDSQGVLLNKVQTQVIQAPCGFSGQYTIPDSVLSIREAAFSDCRGLTELYIPDSVVSIGADAFSDCWGLTAVHFGSGIKDIGDSAFMGCDKLTSIHLPEGLESVGNSAFMNCDQLSEIYLPSTLHTISGETFLYCTALSSITVAEDSPYFYSDGKVLFNKDLTTLVLMAKSYQGEYTVPDTVTRIDDYALSACREMTSILFPSGLKAIGSYAFEQCSGLTELVIPEGVETIENNAFSNCNKVRKLYWPSSVKEVGSLAFLYLHDLEELHIADLTAWCAIDFPCAPFGSSKTNPVCYTEKLFIGGDEVTRIQIPEGVERIGSSTFFECKFITDVIIPASITEIGAGAFAGMDTITLTFEGNVPAFEEAYFDYSSIPMCVFSGTTVTAYYPEGNPTWTEDVMQNYGGTITWVPYNAVTEPETIASGYSGTTTWVLTDDGVMTFSGTGNMKNYGFGRNQPWLDYADQITSIVVEEGVTAIGTGAFMDLTRLESVTLPETGLTKIGEAAFYGCTSLKEIYIPDGIYTIWEYTFKNCTSLESIRLSRTLEKIDQGAFENCTGLETMFLPGNVNIIGAWSFKGCTGLKEVDMQWTDATEIRAGAFKNCTALKKIILPANIQKLGDSCFYGIGATSFTVPTTVTSIEPWCFARAALKEIIFVGDAPAIGEGAFNKITVTAYYPDGNATWTADVMQNYGGEITWKAK